MSIIVDDIQIAKGAGIKNRFPDTRDLLSGAGITVTNAGITAGVGAAGSDTQVQFNDSNLLGGDSDFTWNKTTNLLSLGTLNLDGGTTTPSLYADDAAADTNGESLQILGQNALSNANGGDVELFGGAGVNGSGGSVELIGGNGATDGLGGSIVLDGGTAAGSQRNGDGRADVLETDETKKNGRFILSSNGGPVIQKMVGTMTTTNATSATTTIETLPTADVMYLEARVTGHRTGGAAGTADDSAAYRFSAAYKRVASAAPTVMTAIQSDFSVEDQAGWDATFVVSTNDLRLQVTGATDNNITWHYEITYISSNGSIT